MGRVLALVGILCLLLGLGALALTGWVWFGDWPQEAHEIVRYERSARENAARGPDALVENAGARAHTSLAGTWQALIDPYDRAGLLGLAPRAVEPRAPADLGEFSFENGLTLEVPGDWNTQDPRLVFYQGVVWHARRFDFDPEAHEGRRHFLYFGAANYAAWVYLNGELVGMHEGGFTPFDFEVTDRLRPGENLLVVKVDNRMADDDVPTATTDWANYGGLTREVLLLHLPATFVRGYSVDLEGEAVAGEIEFEGETPPGMVRVAFPELAVSGDFPVEGGRARFRFEDVRPEPWSPEQPRLYRLEIAIPGERIEDEVGFRRVEVRGHEILLNGEPIFLRGISIHDESLDPGGRIHDRDQAEALLAHAVDLGCNFVRLAHYPHDESMLRAADRLGLLVWAEIPVYWNIAFGDGETLARAKRQLSEMITRDRNRASVILWSLGNETPTGAERNRFFSELAAHVRALDDSRLLTAALLTGEEVLVPFFVESYLPALFGWVNETWPFTVDDPLGEIVDVVALNEYFGWYYSGALAQVSPFTSAYARRVMLENMHRIRFDPGVGKPLVVSELGAGAKQGLRAPANELRAYSEEYQALVYERQLDMLARQEHLAGMSPWVLKDFRSPLRLYQGVQDYWNRKGLVDPEGRRKLAFEVLRADYAQRSNHRR
jgi:beta-glucuronidase